MGTAFELLPLFFEDFRISDFSGKVILITFKFCSLDYSTMLLFVCCCSYCSSVLRCSCLQMFLKIGDLKNFVIFAGKYLCWSLFVIKFTPRVSKRLQHRCFLVNIGQLLRTPFLQNTSGG